MTTYVPYSYTFVPTLAVRVETWPRHLFQNNHIVFVSCFTGGFVSTEKKLCWRVKSCDSCVKIYALSIHLPSLHSAITRSNAFQETDLQKKFFTIPLKFERFTMFDIRPWKPFHIFTPPSSKNLVISTLRFEDNLISNPSLRSSNTRKHSSIEFSSNS